MHEVKKKIFQSQYCAHSSMVRHGTARQKFCSYKTEEALQVEPQSNSNLYDSARRGTTYKTGLTVWHTNNTTFECRLLNCFLALQAAILSSKFIFFCSCYSGIGARYAGGETGVSLGNGCVVKSIIQHEIIHALGKNIIHVS